MPQLPCGNISDPKPSTQPQIDQLFMVSSIILPDHFDDQAHDKNSC